ncbi:MAG: site-2 protease family protein [Acidimicrobiia bacterium]|nr:site-2 protease family protein [Acidimicrobiia bacterium]
MGAVVIIVGVLLMVVIHELGHFLAAKAFNMKATEAFFGFGPRIWSTTRGETEYGVKAIPLGGYVRIIGMNPFEEVAPEDEGRTYRENPFWKKSVVVLAGIFSHFVVAFILFYALAIAYGVGTISTEIDNVSTIMASGSGTEEERELVLFVGDEVIAVDGVALAEWVPVEKEAGAVTEVEVLRDGASVTLETTQRLMPAPAAGVDVRVGDVLVEFDGTPIDDWEEFVELAQASPGETVAVVFDRDGTRVDIEVTLATRTIDGVEQGFFGISPLGVVEQPGVFGAVGVAAGDVGVASRAAVQGLWGLVVNFDDLVGAVFTDADPDVLNQVRPVSPIGLVRIAGPLELSLQLLAFVNVFVGVLNFVPLYPLDGGHFAVALYEKIRGREADVRRLLPIAAAVFVFIVVLGLLGFYFDIVDPLQLPE